MVQERRKSPRTRAYRPVRLHHPGFPRVVETLTKDLAVGGLCSLSPTVFPVSTELRIELMLSEGHEPISVRGRAAWFRTIPNSDQFDVGISFLDLSEFDKRRLSVYLDKISRQTASV